MRKGFKIALDSSTELISNFSPRTHRLSDVEKCEAVGEQNIYACRTSIHYAVAARQKFQCRVAGSKTRWLRKSVVGLRQQALSRGGKV